MMRVRRKGTAMFKTEVRQYGASLLDQYQLAALNSRLCPHSDSLRVARWCHEVATHLMELAGEEGEADEGGAT